MSDLDEMIDVVYDAIFRVNVSFRCTHILTRRDAIAALDAGMIEEYPDRAEAERTSIEVEWDSVENDEREAADAAAMKALRVILGDEALAGEEDS
jgi:hypothetical protein